MIVYGWAEKLIKTGELPNKKCQKCESNMAIDVSASYFSLFWIPIFPYSKKLRIVCPNCEYRLKPKDAGEDVKLMAGQLKRSVKIPWYMFSGTILILLAIAYSVFSSYQKNQQYEDFLNDPQLNDVYTFYNEEEPTEYKYSLLKVVGFEGDSIWISTTSYQYNQRPEQLDPADGFYDVYYNYHKNELLELFEVGMIETVIRDYNNGTGFHREIEYIPEDSTMIR